MLNSIIALFATLISEASSWDPASLNAVPVRSNAPALLPEEPSTLVLALIGIGIVGAYVGLQRWRRPQGPATRATGTPASGAQPATDQPRRGAA